MQPKRWLHIQSNTYYPLSSLPWLSHTQYRQRVGVKLKAIASIGNPQRFFSTLQELGIDSEEHIFPDHYQFTYDDLSRWREHVVLMTTKDAVKCQAFASPYWWVLETAVQLPSELVTEVSSLVTAK